MLWRYYASDDKNSSALGHVTTFYGFISISWIPKTTKQNETGHFVTYFSESCF